MITESDLAAIDTQNEYDDAKQTSTGRPRPKLLAKPYPAAFQQLLDSVANGEELPQSILDRIEKNTQMLANCSATNIPQPGDDQQQAHENDNNN